MEFITKDVVTSTGETKKAFYNIVGMEGENGEMVNVRVFNGEFSKEDIQSSIEQVSLQLDELNKKLNCFN